MHLTIRVLGLTLLDLELTEDNTDDEYDGSGITASTPISFTAGYELPDET